MTRHRLTSATGALAVVSLVGLLSAACSSGSTQSGASGTTTPPVTSPSTSQNSPTGPTGQTSGSPRTPAQSSPSGPAPATEFNPPGDIPDNQVFVNYSPPGNHVTIQVPEGWARSTKAGAVTFTDHFNSVGIEVRRVSTAPTVQSARRQDVPAIESASSNVGSVKISTITRAGQQPVLVTYQADSRPDPVTNKVVVDAVERYEFYSHGREAILTLTGPSGADNVDPWRIVSDSVRWS